MTVQVKSNGIEKRFVTESDLIYKDADVQAGEFINIVSNGFCQYTENETILNGVLSTKECTVPAGSVLFNIPTRPLKGTADFVGFIVSANKPASVFSLWISSDGTVRPIVKLELSKGDSLYLSVSFPSYIAGGVQTPKRIISTLPFYFRSEVLV